MYNISRSVFQNVITGKMMNTNLVIRQQLQSSISGAEQNFIASSMIGGWGRQISLLKFITLRPAGDLTLPMATPSCPGANML